MIMSGVIETAMAGMVLQSTLAVPEMMYGARSGHTMMIAMAVRCAPNYYACHHLPDLWTFFVCLQTTNR